jgi:hypothetical protein
MSNDYEWTAWQWVVGLTIVLGSCIVLAVVFRVFEVVGIAWHYWRVRRQLRRAAKRWRSEHGDPIVLAHRDDPYPHWRGRLPDQVGPDLDVRRAESDGENAPGAGARGARD